MPHAQKMVVSATLSCKNKWQYSAPDFFYGELDVLYMNTDKYICTDTLSCEGLIKLENKANTVVIIVKHTSNITLVW